MSKQSQQEALKRQLNNMDNKVDSPVSDGGRVLDIMHQSNNTNSTGVTPLPGMISGGPTTTSDSELRQQQIAMRQHQAQNQTQSQPFDFSQLGEGDLGDIGQFYDDSRQNYIDSQTAQLDKAYANQVAQLEQAYADAVAEGKMSVRDAEREFNQQKKMLEDRSYAEREGLNVHAQQRGIQNSQQLMGLELGASARTSSAMREGMSDRDRRIMDIKDRINAITLQKDLALASAQADRDYGIIGATAEANRMFNESMGNLTQQDYFNRQAMEHDIDMFNRSVEHDIDMFGRSVEHDQFMAEQAHNWDLEKMDKQHGFDLAKMDIQQVHVLEQMAVAHGYDLEKMSQQQIYDLAKMAKQHSYDMSQINQQFKNNTSLEKLRHSNNMSVTAAQFNNAKRMATHNANIAKANAKSEYETARSRELAKYTPGTTEYRIRQSQLDEQFSIMEREIETRAMSEAITQIKINNPGIGKSSGYSSSGKGASGGSAGGF